MKIHPISEWTLYKYRFIIACTAIGLLMCGLLGLYAWQVPPGLSANEQASVVQSHAISFTELPAPHEVINAPYHLLQKASLELFGLTPYGVRLPSMLLAAVAAICMGLTVRRWLKTNVAILSTILLVTSGWLLALGRLGTPEIMVPFWTSILLLSATYISQQTTRAHIWKAVFGLAAGLSLYTPFMIYLFVAAGLAGATQPHLRFLLRQSSAAGITIGAFFFALLLVPVGWAIYNELPIAWTLLAVPAALPEPLQFGKDLWHAISSLVNPFNLGGGEIITPLLSLSAIAIITIGGIRLLNDVHSVRTYVLLIWLAVLIPVIGLNPGTLTMLFVPVMLILAIGLSVIITYWYRLFPLNPYARIFGLIPLFILLFTMIQFNYQRYAYFMTYSQQAGEMFVPDAFLAQNYVASLPQDAPITFIVSPQDAPLYAIIAKNRPETTMQTVPSGSGQFIVAESETARVANSFSLPAHIIVSDRKQDALRFKIYQR